MRKREHENCKRERARKNRENARKGRKKKRYRRKEIMLKSEFRAFSRSLSPFLRFFCKYKKIAPATEHIEENLTLCYILILVT
jgi:hypothetical protein